MQYNHEGGKIYAPTKHEISHNQLLNKNSYFPFLTETALYRPDDG